MIVIRAIGRFFKKIWDWIKQTAWIQPLLIVGIIFGVIFSIPGIVKAVKAANEKKNAAEVYYMQYQLSLEGNENSPADKVTRAILENNQSALGFSESKFFLMYVSENSSIAASAKGGFQVLEKNLGKPSFKTDDDRPFKLLTIFVDQETKATEDDKSAFAKYLERNVDFFEKAGGNAQNTNYYEEGHVSKSAIDGLIEAEESSFQSNPVIMLIDMDIENNSDLHNNRGYENGVTEIMLDVSGNSDYEKAELLLDCWNHSGKFNVND